ncbi:hypothetical protein HanIR_Chr17g0894781 [Helianthus annuus]|nr:hypothetical protein HanIR_Chr17g0894781 [Helianthus annuus]
MIGRHHWGKDLVATKYLFCSQHHISSSRAQGSQHLSLRRILFIHKKIANIYTHIGPHMWAAYSHERQLFWREVDFCRWAVRRLLGR